MFLSGIVTTLTGYHQLPLYYSAAPNQLCCMWTITIHMINGEENLQSVLERVRKAVGLESECSELGSWDIIQILGTHSLLYLSQHRVKIHIHVGYMYRQLKYMGMPLQCVYSIVFIIPCFTMNSVVSSFPGWRTRPGNEANSDDYLHHYLLDLVMVSKRQVGRSFQCWWDPPCGLYQTGMKELTHDPQLWNELHQWRTDFRWYIPVPVLVNNISRVPRPSHPSPPHRVCCLQY